MTRCWLPTLAFLMILGCKSEGGDLFTTPSGEKTGISFQNTVTATEDLNFLDYLYFYNGGGVAVGDINNDSLPDIFFSGNQVKNALYLNKGDLSFEDITDSAGVAGNSSWNTGAVMGDVNGDGLLDIYVCAVVGINGFNGHNELFINNGDKTFTESASQYGLDFDTYSSSAAFLDYDLDGDLDLYLLNHAVHTQESYGKADSRLERNFETGDKLLRNDGGKFTDVSEEAGIFGGPNSYGLGVGIADFNQDGYPDIYVGNDFHEDDYYYLNQGNGTFKESLKDYFGYTTRFSMGNDIADINQDAWPDIMSLDMLPEDEKVLKSSQGDDDIQTQKLRTERYGYHYQFTRNMLHLNQQDAPFSEIGLQSGVAATDWSWSTLFGDYDQDGIQDIFVSNGIPKRPNDLDFINFVSDEQIKNKISNTKLMDKKALDKMPSGKVHNYIFKGLKNAAFEDKSGIWIAKDTLFSGATAIADLDLDGDLDLVVNNVNSPAALYVNQTDQKSNYLKVCFKYKPGNWFGIGTKVLSYHQNNLQYRELYPVRGFQASSQPLVHFGYGKVKEIDSIKIIWPDKTFQVLKKVPVNGTIVVEPQNTRPFSYESFIPKTKPVFKKVEGNLGIDFEHFEDNYFDFNRQKLIPYQGSDRGPATIVGDLDDDGKEDIFFGGSKFVPSRVFFQRDSSYTERRFPEVRSDSVKEIVSGAIEDFNNDGKADLFLGSGGADFFNKMPPLKDSYYLQSENAFIPSEIPEQYENAAVVAPCDFDGDGDTDLFVGNHMVTNDFGKIPNSYLLENENGKFQIVENTALQQAGMITDAVWEDYDKDGFKDLILVGEWMSPKFFRNLNGTLQEEKLLQDDLRGLWQSLVAFDIDGDGDTDYVLGNWGLNSKFKASVRAPLKMYYGDFDNNKTTETIVAIEKHGSYYPIEGLQGLSAQLETLRKRFTSYSDFAGKSVEEIMDANSLKNAKLYEATELRSGYLENNKGRFHFVPFEADLQVAPILAFLKYDFDGNGKEELLAAGNYFGVKPFHGRLGSFPGAVIKNKNNVVLGHRIGLDFVNKSARSLNIIRLNKQPYLLATFNNEKAQVYELIN